MTDNRCVNCGDSGPICLCSFVPVKEKPMTDDRKVPESALIHANAMLREESALRVEAMKRAKALEAENSQLHIELDAVEFSYNDIKAKLAKAVKSLAKIGLESIHERHVTLSDINRMALEALAELQGEAGE